MLRRVSFFLFIAVLLTSCSMVKHSPSASFKKVKYNSHLKFAKKNSPAKIDEMAYDQVQKGQENERFDSTLSEIPKSTYKFKEKNRSHLRKIRKVKRSASNLAALMSGKKAVEKSQHKNAQPFNPPVPNFTDRAVNHSLAPLEPIAVDDNDVLDLIYIILLVLLVLIVVGFIIDLSGGLLGTLIAILLILLILHLLGLI